MDDHARALFKHRWQERAIKPDGRQQIKVERAIPFVVIEHRKAARRRRRSADDMDEDVETADAITNCVGHDGAAFGCGKIRGDEQIGVGELGRCLSSGGEDLRASFSQPRDYCFPDPLGAARDQRPAAIQFEIVAHERISSAAILSRSSVKTNSSSIGLPGKLPVSRLVTMVLPSF